MGNNEKQITSFNDAIKTALIRFQFIFSQTPFPSNPRT